MWKLFLLVMLLIPGPVLADIYKCTSQDGQIIFSNTPCTGVTVETYHKETEEERQQRKARQRKYEIARQEKERLAVMEAQIQQTINLIEAGSFDAAKQYADEHGLAYAQILLRFQQNILAQQKRQQQELEQLKGQLTRQQAILAKRQAELTTEQVDLAKQQSALQSQQQDLEKQRYWASRYAYPQVQPRHKRRSKPQYVQSIGKWCQQRQGVIHCWGKDGRQSQGSGKVDHRRH